MKELSLLFDRDINRIKKEITLYNRPAAIWMVQEGISNSAGNLVLHICGNLRHYIGKVLGNVSYERNRDIEFSAKNISAAQLLRLLDETATTVITTLQHLPAEQLSATYPEMVFDRELTTGQFLMHLYGHLNYHSGQINYHRRLISNP